MFPFRKQKKIYYGWAIVGVTFLIGATEAGAFQNILAVFLKPMADAFGWSRTLISVTMVFGSLSGGLISPFIGPVLDKHGPRMVAFFSVLVLSAGLVSLAWLEEIWQLYLFFGVGRMVAVGILSLVISVAVSNWFIRLRGRAMGIAWLGPRLGAAILPALAQYFILTQGWRFAWAALGIVVFLMSGIPSLLFLRRRPEDIGLLPDGDVKIIRKGAKKPGEIAGDENQDARFIQVEEPDWTRREAIHTRAFWLLILVSSIFPFIQAGINFHLFPFLTDRGLSESLSIMLISTFALSGSIGAFSCGFLAERIGSKVLLIINGFASALVFLGFYLAVTYGGSSAGWIGLLFVLQAVTGMMHGGLLPLMSIIWADFFGRHSLGSIQGFAAPFRFGANALGPIATALCFDYAGNYSIPFYSFVALFFIAGVVSLSLPTPGALKKPE
jgi:OFA family oxalate/formate antiporter-like MFS transporter